MATEEVAVAVESAPAVTEPEAAEETAPAPAKSKKEAKTKKAPAAPRKRKPSSHPSYIEVLRIYLHFLKF